MMPCRGGCLHLPDAFDDSTLKSTAIGTMKIIVPYEATLKNNICGLNGKSAPIFYFNLIKNNLDNDSQDCYNDKK